MFFKFKLQDETESIVLTEISFIQIECTGIYFSVSDDLTFYVSCLSECEIYNCITKPLLVAKYSFAT